MSNNKCRYYGGDFSLFNFLLLVGIVCFLIILTSLTIKIQADTHVIRMDCCSETQFETQTWRMSK